MAKKYLDYDGLLYFWQKLKTAFASISHTHTKSEITDFPSTMPPSSHTHGNITNAGALQSTDITIASGDKLVVTDSSNSNKVARTSVAFDGSTTTQALTKAGTFQTFNNYTHPSYTAKTASAVKVGNDATGHVVIGDALATSDLTNDSDFVSDASYVHTDNNYTSTEKTKLAGIATGAEVNVQSDWNVTDSASDAFIKNKPTIETYSDFTGATASVAGTHGLVPAPASGDQGKLLYGDGNWEQLKFTKSFSENGIMSLILERDNNKAVTTVSLNNATTTSSGTMSPDDKTKLDKVVFNGSVLDSSILPSFVDDVIEAYPRTGATELTSSWLSTTSGGSALTPEAGKIYVLMADSTSYSANSQFRWGGTAYVKLSDGGVSEITNSEIDTIVAS